MKKLLLVGALAPATMLAASGVFSLSSQSFQSNHFLSTRYAYCQPNGHGQVRLSDDISPQLSWKYIPRGAKSFVLTAVDIDGATSPHFDQQGYQLKLHSKRAPFAHWLVANIPARVTSLPAGAGSKGFVANGKKPGATAYGLMGLNDYTFAFSSPFRHRIAFKPYQNQSLKGFYGRYDGPCAPWNDPKVHRIIFTVYAVNVAKLPGLKANGHYTLPMLQKALQGHVLAKASLLTKYATHARLVAR